MLKWGQQPVVTKTNWEPTKAYFEDLIKATDTFLQNVDGNNSGRNRYESASNLANVGNKICEYIAKIATAAQGNNSNSNNQFEAVAAQIRAPTKTVSKLSPGQKIGDENKNPNTENYGSTKSRRPQMTK
jgi:hypothetical protein